MSDNLQSIDVSSSGSHTLKGTDLSNSVWEIIITHPQSSE